MLKTVVCSDSQKPVQDASLEVEGDGGVLHLEQQPHIRLEAQVRGQVQLRDLHTQKTSEKN